MPTRSSEASTGRRVAFAPRGDIRRLFACHDNEVLVEGPAGTGKSFACLWKVHLAALRHPGMRALVARKTLVSLTASALVTYTERVLGSGRFAVNFFGGSKLEPAHFRYPNGSRVVVGGLDNAAKIMSSEYDLAYVNEATELTESDWEAITTRLRYGVMPYQQLFADCNPAAPSHWLNQRALHGTVTRIGSRHEDNPTLWDPTREAWTPRGASYLAVLDRLTGVRYQRLRLGRWVAAEGQVYDAWDDDVHLVDRAAVAPQLEGAWHFGTVDWGWTNPGVAQVWAVDGDGRLYRVAEHYHTRRPVDSWWVPRMLALQEQYRCRTWVCDPSEPAYMAQLRDAGLPVQGAKNALLPGINATQDRLRATPDDRPRLVFVRDALLAQDPGLVEAKLPWCTEHEVPEYVWAKNAGGQTLKDTPVDANNHGLDATRYAVAYRDLGAKPPLVAAGSILGSLFRGGDSDDEDDDRW